MPLKVLEFTRSMHVSNTLLKDTVFIKNLSAIAITGKDAWNRPTPQPINISVSLKTDFQRAFLSDNLKYSLNYAVISRNIFDFMKSNESRNFSSLANIAESISSVVLDEKKGGGDYAEISISSNKSEIRADTVEYSMVRSKKGVLDIPDRLNVYGLKLLTVIGVFTFERLQRQIVDIDLSLSLRDSAKVAIHEIIDDVTEYVEASNFKTVEALVKKIGQLILQKYDEGVKDVSARVTKPNAIPFTDGVGVSSDMKKELFEHEKPIELKHGSKFQYSDFNLPTLIEDSELDFSSEHTAFIAFGSNQGDQIEHINNAISLLQKYEIQVVGTSSLYISKPMYFKDQPDFYNGVIKVIFKEKSAQELLQILKRIEYAHEGRVKEFDNGPRTIDLDILLIDDAIINTNDLVVPHKAMLERTFVLRPLCELLAPDVLHPVSAEPIHSHLHQLSKSQLNKDLQDSSHLLQLIPLPRVKGIQRSLVFDEQNNSSRTLVMGILNITPDSFSDGGKYHGKSLEDVLQRVRILLEQGADIIDIGGASTRPGSKQPSEEEEIERVVPVVKHIRASCDADIANAIISIDTFSSKVAEASLDAGADIINDISMGRFDERIFEVVAKAGCPYIATHSRGFPENMSKLTQYDANVNEDMLEYIIDQHAGHNVIFENPYVENLITAISRELALQLEKAYKYGIKKWQIILDPGIGFAKKLDQNLAIIKHASAFKNYSILINKSDPANRVVHTYVSFYGLPTLMGTSRKKFLGTIAQDSKPEERVISTAASVVSSIQQKADIVRVHDVKEMKKACLIADAIYKNIF